MSLNRQIHNAYDKVHAPEEVVDRLKSELAAKNASEDAEHEIYHSSRRYRPQIGGYLVYIAAVFALCAAGGMAWNSIQQYKNPIHPGMAVYTEAPPAETGAEQSVPDITNLYYEDAVRILRQNGFNPECLYEINADVPPQCVIRTEPPANTPAARDSTVKVYVSGA